MASHMQGYNERITRSRGTELGIKPVTLAECYVTNSPHFSESKEVRKGANGILRRDPRSRKNFGGWELVGRHGDSNIPR